MCEIYKIFSHEWKHICDYSHNSMVELYLYESRGEGHPDKLNGYYVGKRWLNVYVDMWRQDIEDGILFKFELYYSGRFPTWWLDSVLSGVQQNTIVEYYR